MQQMNVGGGGLTQVSCILDSQGWALFAFSLLHVRVCFSVLSVDKIEAYLQSFTYEIERCMVTQFSGQIRQFLSNLHARMRTPVLYNSKIR